MTVEYKILFNADIPEAFESALGRFVSTAQTLTENYIFTHGGENENLYFTQLDWNKVKRPEFAFLEMPILKSEVAQLIIRRAAGNVGALNIDDLKDDLIEKSYTVKILNDYSLGHISDIVLNFAAERDVDTVLIRPYTINLLNFLTSLAKSDVISFPIDLDCGFSEDTFFIQAHCHNNEFVLENILDTLKSGPVGSISGQFDDILKYSDLLDVFTIATSKKLVFTGCWFYQGIWDEQRKSYPSLIIHDVPSLSLESENLDNSVNTFIKQSLENISNINLSAASLAEKYKIKRDNEIIEAINPVTVKTLYNFLKDKVQVPVNDDFNVESLDAMLESYPSKYSINKEEKKELLKLLKNSHSYEDLYGDVQRVKSQISKEDYISELISNVSDMSLEDIDIVFDNNDEQNEVTIVSGVKEIENGYQRIKGSIEEEKESVEVIRGSVERITEGAMKVKSLSSNVSENEMTVKHDPAENTISQEEILKRVKASNINQENNHGVWEVKRLNVINKMKTELENAEHLSPEQINEKVESILQSELGVEVSKSKQFVEECSDSIAEEWVAKGVDSINEEITKRLKMEKFESQLLNRDKQVGKMKELITKLKIENGNLNSLVRNLEKENKVADFNMRKEEDELNTLSIASDASLSTNADSPGTDKKYNELEGENEKLRGQMELLKKRVSFMYENSKTNAGTSLSSNEIQSIVDENARLKEVVATHLADFDKVKKEKRDTELLLDKKSRELEVKNEMIAQYDAEKDSKNAIKAANEISTLNEAMRQLHQENKDSILKAKAFEQKLKYATVQLERYRKQEKKVVGSGKGAAGVIDLKMKSQLKNLEMVQGKMKQSLDKSQKELAQKKSELHKAKLENKTMSVKLRDLQKKLDFMGRKAS